MTCRKMLHYLGFEIYTYDHDPAGGCCLEMKFMGLMDRKSLRQGGGAMVDAGPFKLRVDIDREMLDMAQQLIAQHTAQNVQLLGQKDEQ